MVSRASRSNAAPRELQFSPVRQEPDSCERSLGAVYVSSSANVKSSYGYRWPSFSSARIAQLCVHGFSTARARESKYQQQVSSVRCPKPT